MGIISAVLESVFPSQEGLRAGTVGIRWGVGWGANSSIGEGVRVGKGE